MAGDIAFLEDKISDLIQLVGDMLVAMNGLRMDFRAHDHGTSYGQRALRINTSADAITGTEQSAAVTSQATPSDLEQLFTQMFMLLGADAAMINRITRF